MKMVVCGLLLAVAPLAMAQGGVDRSTAYYHFSLGQQARLSGRLDEALEHYRKAIASDPRSAALRTEMARLLREAGQSDAGARRGARGGAARPRRRGRPGVPGGAAAPRGRARRRRLVRAGGGDGARGRAAPAPGRRDRHARAGRSSTARRASPRTRPGCWEKQVEADPRDVDALLQLGLHYFAQGKSDLAQATLQKALEVEPTSPPVILALAEIYEEAEQTEQAVLHYRKALELEPGNIRVRLKLGDLLLRARRPEEALAEAEAVLAADAREPFRARPQGPRPARPAALRRGAGGRRAAARGGSERPGQRLPEGHDRGGAPRLRGGRGRARAPAGAAAPARERREGRARRPDAAHPPGRRLPAARPPSRTPPRRSGGPRTSGGEPDAALLAHHVEALILAKDLERALTEVARRPQEVPGRARTWSRSRPTCSRTAATTRAPSR